jgi:DNA-binding XRE family transcriptional regulator
VKIDLALIKSGDRESLNLLLKVVTKCAKSGARKVGAQEIEEDVAQEVFMLFIRNLIFKFDESYNLESLLIETSRRVALSLIRGRRELLLDDDNDLMTNLIDDISMRNSIEDLPISESEQRMALETIKMNFPGIEVGVLNPPSADPDSMVKRRGRAERDLSKENARLRDIRMKLSLSQEDFADRLGIHTATLQSYEYGRTAVAPQSVMDRAEELFKEEAGLVKRNLSIKHVLMPELVKEWATMLNVAENDFTALSELIGVSKSTIHRWVHDGSRPNPRELARYIRKVKMLSAQIKASYKAISENY